MMDSRIPLPSRSSSWWRGCSAVLTPVVPARRPPVAALRRLPPLAASRKPVPVGSGSRRPVPRRTATRWPTTLGWSATEHAGRCRLQPGPHDHASHQTWPEQQEDRHLKPEVFDQTTAAHVAATWATTCLFTISTPLRTWGARAGSRRALKNHQSCDHAGVPPSSSPLL